MSVLEASLKWAEKFSKSVLGDFWNKTSEKEKTNFSETDLSTNIYETDLYRKIFIKIMRTDHFSKKHEIWSDLVKKN